MRTLSSRVMRVAALGPELVQADPADHDDQPAADVVDLIDVGADQPGERLLHGVLGLAQVAEHAEGDVEHVTSLVAPRPAELDVHVALVGGGAPSGLPQQDLVHGDPLRRRQVRPHRGIQFVQ